MFNLFRLRTAILLSIFLLQFIEIRSLDWNTSLVAFTGYRRDKITTDIETFNSSASLIEKNKLTVDNIDLVEFGIRARITMDNCWTFRGFASWGLITQGNYQENLSNTMGDKQNNTADLLGRISQDDSVSLGYSYPLSPNLALEGLFGWSYDKLILKMHDFKENGLPDPTLEKLYYRMQWQGPWIGLSLMYDPCIFFLYTGYEFHKPNWKAQYSLPGYNISTQVFSDRRWSNDVQGHILFFELSAPVMCHCRFGFRAQYQYWLATNGKSQSIQNSFALLGIPPGQSSRVSRATWSSGGIQFNLEVIF